MMSKAENLANKAQILSQALLNKWANDEIDIVEDYKIVSEIIKLAIDNNLASHLRIIISATIYTYLYVKNITYYNGILTHKIKQVIENLPEEKKLYTEIVKRKIPEKLINTIPGKYKELLEYSEDGKYSELQIKYIVDKLLIKIFDTCIDYLCTTQNLQFIKSENIFYIIYMLLENGIYLDNIAKYRDKLETLIKIAKNNGDEELVFLIQELSQFLNFQD